MTPSWWPGYEAAAHHQTAVPMYAVEGSQFTEADWDYIRLKQQERPLPEEIVQHVEESLVP